MRPPISDLGKVLVIGGANLDIKAKSFGPHVQATSNPAAIITKPGGVGRNIAHNLAVMGVETTLLTALGEDAHGDMILAVTEQAGVDISKVQRSHTPTGTYLALLDQNGELVTAASDMNVLSVITPAVIEAHAELIQSQDLIVADCNLSTDCLVILGAIASSKLIVEPVSVVKSTKLLELLNHSQVYLATPNLDQLEALTSLKEPAIAAPLLHRLGLQNLVVHAGQQGAFVSDGTQFRQVPSAAQKIVDVTGAGDAATAGLVAGLVQGMSLAKAAELGQKMAAEVIASEFSTLT